MGGGCGWGGLWKRKWEDCDCKGSSEEGEKCGRGGRGGWEKMRGEMYKGVGGWRREGKGWGSICWEVALPCSPPGMAKKGWLWSWGSVGQAAVWLLFWAAALEEGALLVLPRCLGPS